MSAFETLSLLPSVEWLYTSPLIPVTVYQDTLPTGHCMLIVDHIPIAIPESTSPRVTSTQHGKKYGRYGTTE
jgi:hypothetical protein